MSNIIGNKRQEKQDSYSKQERSDDNRFRYQKNRKQILRQRRIVRREATLRAENIAKIVRLLEKDNVPVALQVGNVVAVNRVWAMPSKHTFTIKPIAELLQRYCGDGAGWIDPFAGENSPAEITNDLNPAKPTKFHLHAKEFAGQLPGLYSGVLLDPPYSLRQVKECYDSIGAPLFQDDTQRFPQNVKELIAPKIMPGGYAICFGWNSQGFGKNLGFELVELLLVAHGRSHNDTIVTVERKIY